jgi:hypothetical protein
MSLNPCSEHDGRKFTSKVKSTVHQSWQLGSQFTSIEDGRISRHVNGSNSHTSGAIFVLMFGRLIMV